MARTGLLHRRSVFDTFQLVILEIQGIRQIHSSYAFNLRSRNCSSRMVSSATCYYTQESQYSDRYRRVFWWTRQLNDSFSGGA